MIFKCKCCKQEVDEKPRFTGGLTRYAYSPEWLKVGEPVPPLDERFWLRSDILPKAGERRIIKVGYYTPFDRDVGDSFNALYQPAYSALNGWDLAPEELECSAIVKCFFENIISADEYMAWIEITVKRVIPLPKMCTRYPVCKVDRLYNGGFVEYTQPDFTWNGWEYSSFDAQGDCGDWRLIFTDGENVRHLIMLCEWGWHGGFVLFGNAVADYSNPHN